MGEVSSLNRTRWECKYHIVLIPKHRKKVLFGRIRKEIHWTLYVINIFSVISLAA